MTTINQQKLITKLSLKEKNQQLTIQDIFRAEKLLSNNVDFTSKEWIVTNPKTHVVYIYQNRQLLPKMLNNHYVVLD